MSDVGSKKEKDQDANVVAAFEGPLPFNLKAWLRKHRLQKAPDFLGTWKQFEKTYEQLWRTELLQLDPQCRQLLLRIAASQSLEEINSDISLLQERSYFLIADYQTRKEAYLAEQEQKQQKGKKPSSASSPSNLPAPPSSGSPLVTPAASVSYEQNRRLHARLDGSGGRNKLGVESTDEEEQEDRSFLRM